MRKDGAYIANLQHVRYVTAECGDLDAEVAVPNPHRPLTFGASASGVATWTFEERISELRNGIPFDFCSKIQFIPIHSNSFFLSSKCWSGSWVSGFHLDL